MLAFKDLFKNHRPRRGGLEILKYIGPGFLVTVGFIDPGNWAANVAAGAEFGYCLLWMVTLSTIMLIVLQHNAAHLGIAPGLCLSEASTKFLHPWVSRIMLATAMLATMATALAVAEAVETCGVPAQVKWPNDVLVDRRKVAGSLVECATSDRHVDWVILGVGVNVNVTRGALQAALGKASHAAGSLAEAARREIDRNAFAAAFLNLVDEWTQIYALQGAAPVVEAWRDRDILTGRRVEVRGEGTVYEGRVLGVDREGYLVVRDARGERRRVLDGEIRLFD